MIDRELQSTKNRIVSAEIWDAFTVRAYPMEVQWRYQKDIIRVRISSGDWQKPPTRWSSCRPQISAELGGTVADINGSYQHPLFMIVLDHRIVSAL